MGPAKVSRGWKWHFGCHLKQQKGRINFGMGLGGGLVGNQSILSLFTSLLLGRGKKGKEPGWRSMARGLFVFLYRPVHDCQLHFFVRYDNFFFLGHWNV